MARFRRSSGGLISAIPQWLYRTDHQQAPEGGRTCSKRVHARDDQGQDGGNGAGSGNDKKERPALLAVRLKEKPVDIKPLMVKTD